VTIFEVALLGDPAVLVVVVVVVVVLLEGVIPSDDSKQDRRWRMESRVDWSNAVSCPIICYSSVGKESLLLLLLLLLFYIFYVF
jgi:hypothetical protein